MCWLSFAWESHSFFEINVGCGRSNGVGYDVIKKPINVGVERGVAYDDSYCCRASL